VETKGWGGKDKCEGVRSNKKAHAD